MASLPAKPQGSPSRDAPNRFQDERDRRPQRPPPHRVDDRSFSRRWASGGDSYAPAYDPRREAEFHRRDIDNRIRESWDRPRGSDPRFGRGPSDYDRDRRGYERRGYYISNPRHRDPYVRRDVPRWRSRSPSRRDRSRSRSPYVHKRVKLGNHSVDTSPRRSSPHRPSRYSRSRSRDASWRPRSKSPRLEPATSLNPVKTENVIPETGTSHITAMTHDSEASHQDTPLSELVPPPQDFNPVKKEEEEGVKIPTKEEVEPQIDQTLPVAKDEPPYTGTFVDQRPTRLHSPTLASHSQLLPEQKHTYNISSHLKEHLSDKQTRDYGKLEDEHSYLMPSEPRARSPSPPRHPRQRGPPGPSYYPRHRSRSPPKGPRNHPGTQPRGHITPTGPASTHPPGPRGQRRPLPPNSLSSSLPQPSTSQTQSPVTPSLPAPMEDIKPTIPQAPEVVKVPLPAIPIKQLPQSLTLHLDNEISRLQLQRAHLVADHTNLAKEIRRALHELDTTTIDLHAAELRRKIADAQHEKARNGLLGIDYIPPAEARM